MTHQEAVDTLATERYLLDEMSEGDRHAFEEHYFACDVCAEDVRTASRMGQAAKDVFAAESSARPATATVVNLADAKTRRWSRSPVVPWALAASLAMFAAYQSLLVVPELRASRALDPITLRPDARGEEPAVRPAPGLDDITLALDVNDVREGADLSYDIKDASGRQVAARHAKGPRAGAPLLLLGECVQPGRGRALRAVHYRRDRPVARDLSVCPFTMSQLPAMPDIDRRRRFVFRGNAAAIGGRIVRPKDVVLESNVASSLTVAGGRSAARGTGLRFDEYISIDSAATFAEGLFDKVQEHVDLTYRRVTADALSTSTRVEADVVGLHVGTKVKLSIRRLRAELSARSPYVSGEPAIAVGDRTIVEGVDIGGHPLRLEIAPEIFQRYDTRAKLMMAADDPRSADELVPHLLLASDLHGVPLPPRGRLIQTQATIYSTIVEVAPLGARPLPGRDDHRPHRPRPRVRQDRLRRAADHRSLAPPDAAPDRVRLSRRRRHGVRRGGKQRHLVLIDGRA